MSKLIQNKSRSRRLQYQWLVANSGQLSSCRKVLDLGGVKEAEYHALLKLKPPPEVHSERLANDTSHPPHLVRWRTDNHNGRFAWLVSR